MAISTGTKLGFLALGILALGSAVYNKVERLKNATTRFLFNVYFLRIHSLRSGSFTLVYKADIKNLSGFTVPLENVFVLVQFSKDKGMNWDNIGASTKRVLKLTLIDNQTTSQEFPIEFLVTDTLNSLFEKSNRYRIVLNYEVYGKQQRYVTAYDLTKAIEKIPGFRSLKGTNPNQLI